jgi:VanZ family protein
MTRRASRLTFFELFMRYWLPVFAYVTVIIFLSAQPNLRPPLQFRNSDKLYHLVEYFGFGVLVARALRATLRIRNPVMAALVALSLGICMGTIDEYFQSFVPGRQSSAFDLLADTTGVAIAQLAFLALVRD